MIMGSGKAKFYDNMGSLKDHGLEGRGASGRYMYRERHRAEFLWNYVELTQSRVLMWNYVELTPTEAN